MNGSTDPKLTIVVICFNMQREAQRTLYSLSCDYQRGVSPSEYQVIVIDNNSSSPLNREFVEGFGENFEYHFFNTKSVSPAEAINFGADLAKGKMLSCIVDGARILSPGVVQNSLLAAETFDNPLVMTLAWHLGPKEQNFSMLEGYDQAEEDQLLASVNWQDDGYKLFDVSTQASSSKVGIKGGIPEELSYFTIKKSLFLELGGFCDQFQSPGGGLINHDFLQRAMRVDELDLVMLVGEGSFHQFHGGIATNAKPENNPWALFAQEYLNIRGAEFKLLTQPASTDINYIGSIPQSAQRFINTE